MITEAQIKTYTNSLLDLKRDETDDLYDELSAKGHPVIRRDAARFLAQTVMLKQPQKILELGTNAGYSAIVMAKRLKNGKIVSVDYRADHQLKARENFIKYGVSDKIELINGYAQNILPELNENFDIIFIDADKKGYPLYLDYAVNHLCSGGMILVDNLFWKGSVIAPEEFNNEKSAAPSLIEFNKTFSALEGFNAQVLSIGDGLGFAVKEE
jgi:predicted O-methyltransferase YrrM